MGNMVDYAKHELDRIKKDEYGMQERINNNILDIVKVFEDQGHSGLTAGYVIGMLYRLLKFLPITQLTGEDDEWNKIFDGKYQNKRCFSIFRDKDGRAYDSEGKIFSDNGGYTWFTNRGSRVYIEFPYYPPDHPERVYVDEDGNDISDQPEKIEALRKAFEEKYHD